MQVALSLGRLKGLKIVRQKYTLRIEIAMQTATEAAWNKLRKTTKPTGHAGLKQRLRVPETYN